ncbi:MAG: alpha/beta hydrolase [Candidatus Sumerlaeaceae bacterium]|nr:alpha/beta hydrolase [Candidatus Sumerlaeaceae bacterium]
MKLTRDAMAMPPIVFLHAFPLDSRMWREQVACLSKKTTVLTPNVRGFGGAKGAQECAAWSIGCFAFDVLSLIDQQGIERVILAGCSMGGYTAFEFWRRYPARVAGMILCDTRAEADSPEIRQRRRDQIERIRREGTSFLGEFVEEMLISPKTREHNPSLVRELRQWAAEAPAEAVIGVLEALAARPDSIETLPTINVPVLLIYGEDDVVTPKECGVRMLSRLPHATMEIVPDAGHLAPLENPAVVNSAIEDYLVSLDAWRNLEN